MRPLLPLVLGLALGSAATWLVLRPGTPSSRSASASAAESSATATSPLIHPASYISRLPAAEADAALAAYLALVSLPDKAPPAELADRSARLRALLTVLPTASFDRLFAALALRTGSAEASLRRLAFAVWTERDAPGSARWAASIIPGEAINEAARLRYATQAASAWARREFDAAYAWSSTLPDAKLRDAVAHNLLGLLAATAPERALALARAVGEEFSAAAQKNIFNAWMEKNPAAAVQSLGATLLADNQARWRVHEALGKWAVTDPRGVFDWLDTQSGLEPNALRSAVWSLVNRVASGAKNSDIRPFADALTARHQAGGGQDQLSELLRSWGRRDSASAFAWLDSLPDAALRNDLLTSAIERYSSSRPEENLPLVLHLPPGPLRDATLSKALATWAEQDPDAALAWLRDHDDPSLATVAARLQGSLLGQLASADPASALARWQSLPSDESRIAAAPGIAKAWAGTDPASAARWIFAQLPELPDMRPEDFEKLSPQAQVELQQKFMAYEGHFEVLSRTSAEWCRKDPAALVAWAEGLSSPLLKEVILDSIGQNFVGYQDEVPDHAVRAAEIAAIPNAALRDRILGEHLKNWLGSDLHAAREWIDTHDALSPEKAAEILTKAAASQ